MGRTTAHKRSRGGCQRSYGASRGFDRGRESVRRNHTRRQRVKLVVRRTAACWAKTREMCRVRFSRGRVIMRLTKLSALAVVAKSLMSTDSLALNRKFNPVVNDSPENSH